MRSFAVCSQFHCLVEEWKDCEELKPQPKERWTFSDKKREETVHRSECCCQQESVHEMWKKQQVHENARTMYRAEVLVKEEHFLGSWLREDVEGRADMKEWEKETGDEESKSG